MMRGLVVLLALAWGTLPADAQTILRAPGAEPTGAAAEVLPRFDFQVGMEHLGSDDPRFVWDANFGGDIDLVRVGRTRVTFVANYQTILGSEFRRFDPNQGNYTLEGAVSTRAGALEVAGVFHHLSRHLSDRPKRQAVDWNMVGGRVRGGGRAGRAQYQARADLRGAIKHTYVDYTWELDTEASAVVEVSPRLAFVAAGGWRMVGVDGSRDRGTLHGVRGEGGIRLLGRGAVVDLLVAAEQRIDPYQLEFSTVRWVTAGFRVSSVGTSRVP